MKNKIQVLLSLMNVKDENEYKKIIQKNKIAGKVISINQVKNENDIFNIINKEQKIYSYNEKGASKSRNKLLDKANSDILVFADDDTEYVDNYKEIIEKAYNQNPKAEIIIFFADNENKNREKNKRIGNKKINFLDIMKVRSNEITLKRETLEKIKRYNIKFDENFGPGEKFQKGEETIFISDLFKHNFKIYSVDEKIATGQNLNSTWFTGFDEKFLYSQGAIFYRIAPKWYKILVYQYLIRKYNLYKENFNMMKAYKYMINGVNDCKEIYDGGRNEE